MILSISSYIFCVCVIFFRKDKKNYLDREQIKWLLEVRMGGRVDITGAQDKFWG